MTTERRDGMSQIHESMEILLRLQHEQTTTLATLTERIAAVDSKVVAVDSKVEAVKVSVEPMIRAWQTGQGIYGMVGAVAKIAGWVAAIGGAVYWLLHGGRPSAPG